MRTTVERLRLSILVVAGLLVAGILLFFGYARWQARRIAHDLPEKLGISIQQSTQGFTFSKSEGGHTLFTLHAAKTVQYKGGGHADLKDVSITLYNASGAPADRIYGNDFDYDPANGIIRANGAVQIDLEGPAGPAPAAANLPTPEPSEASESKDIVHVKTADLVFNQKTGLASTAMPIEFRISEAAGSATGASFDSRKGVLVLDRDVSFDSSLEGSPLKVRAQQAQFDRTSRQLYLLETVTGYQSSHSSSDQAIVYFRPDGSAFRIQAQGHVTVMNENQKITSQHARADLDAKSRPRQIALRGGVVYTAKDAVRRLRGTAAEGTLLFGPQATLRRAQLRKTVSITDEEGGKNPPVGERRMKSYRPVRSVNRDLEAAAIDVDFVRAPDGRPEARQILATGDAKLNIRTLYANALPQETAVEGDRLLATLRNGVALSDLHGTGHTKLTLLGSNGVKQTSTGDNLRMTFAHPPGSAAVATNGKAQLRAPQQTAQLESAEQDGNVILVQVTPPKVTPVEENPARTATRVSALNHHVASSAGSALAAKEPSVSTATAARAVYQAATQSIRLSGNPRLSDAGGDLTASTIDFERLTGNATASGSVKVTYRQSAGRPQVNFDGSGPVHVVAAQAHLDHAKGLSIFYAGSGKRARLWQGDDSISAPVIEISLARRTLAAYGRGGLDAEAGGTDEVEATLTGMDTASGGKAAQAGKRRQSSVARVNSRSFLYSDAEAKAVFRGGVVAYSSSGTMRSNQMDVYFATASGKESVGEPQQKVERIVAQEDVELQEPGRKATGAELIYTSQDGKFVLTGSLHSPPRLVDQVHGTVTGASLIFNDRDDSVMVSGGPSRAVTETRVAK